MNQSYKNSKVYLKPLEQNDFIKHQSPESTKKQQKITPKKKSLADMFDFSKPAEVIKPTKSKQIQNSSWNTDELLNSDDEAKPEQQDFDRSLQLSSSNTFKYQQYKDVKQEEILEQIQAMRSEIVQMNQSLNFRLDKYELMGEKVLKKDVFITDPIKFYSRLIKNNQKTIWGQIVEKKQLSEKQKLFEEKDILVQVQQLIIAEKRKIHDLKKENHQQWVKTEKVDRDLWELKQNREEEIQFRQVKSKREKIIYYFKKLHQHKIFEDQVNQQEEILKQRFQQMSKKLIKYQKLAVDNQLQVSSNQNYIELKKDYQDIFQQKLNQKKKNNIIVKSILVNQDKIQRDIRNIKQEIEDYKQVSMEYQSKSAAIQKYTKNLMIDYGIGNKKFHLQAQKINKTNQAQLKPDFKRLSSKDQKSSVSSYSATSKSSMSEEKSKHSYSRKNASLNDKNLATLEEENLNENFKNKPNFGKNYRSIKLSKEKPYNPEIYKTLEHSNIFRPPKILNRYRYRKV